MIKEPRYRKRIAQDEHVKDQLLRQLGITPGEYFLIEVETGTLLLNIYFKDMPNDALVAHYKKELLYNPVHGYWTWLVNQKRIIDTKLLDTLLEWNVTRDHYFAQLMVWCQKSATHKLLRHFIMQSPTLHV